jgi:hypothetical protein
MIATWILIGLIAVILFVLIFKSQDLLAVFSIINNYLFFFIVAGIVLFFIFSLVHIHSNYDVDLSDSKGLMAAGKIYFGWFKGILSNVGDITGYATKQDWFYETNVSVDKLK